MSWVVVLTYLKAEVPCSMLSCAIFFSTYFETRHTKAHKEDTKQSIDQSITQLLCRSESSFDVSPDQSSCNLVQPNILFQHLLSSSQFPLPSSLFEASYLVLLVGVGACDGGLEPLGLLVGPPDPVAQHVGVRVPATIVHQTDKRQAKEMSFRGFSGGNYSK